MEKAALTGLNSDVVGAETCRGAPLLAFFRKGRVLAHLFEDFEKLVTSLSGIEPGFSLITA